MKFEANFIDEAFDKISSTEYGKIVAEEGKLTKAKNSVNIDSWNIGSFPLSLIDDFEYTLDTLLSKIAEKTELERFVYGDGFYKLILDPAKPHILLKKVSAKDPHHDDPVIKPGEKVSVNITEEDIVEKLTEVTENEHSAELLKTYYDMVKKYLKNGDTVATPLGTLTKTQSLVVGEGDITTFVYSKKL